MSFDSNSLSGDFALVIGADTRLAGDATPTTNVGGPVAKA